MALPVEPSLAVERFVASAELPTPYLVLDPYVVADRYNRLAAALPGAEIHYAVKACPHPEVLWTLAALGSGFDVASVGEVRLAVAAGADPDRICYGNPVRGPADIAAAHAAGVRRFVSDSAEDVRLLAATAPGARVLVRLLVSDAGSATPFAAKFGAVRGEAVRLLGAVADAGLVADGVAFHSGSQQLRPDAFADGITEALSVAAAAGLPRPVLDLGGGFPVAYLEPVPDIAAYAAAIHDALAGAEGVRLMLEPGRALVAESGLIRSTVLRVSRRPGVDDRRWVYLDVGRYSGLAETENEAIAYRVRVPGRSGPAEPVVLAGPTCDGDDVLYRRTPCPLPLSLEAGDVVDLLVAGAYTASYASVAFNGLPPLPVHTV
ncbi:type III PLP-dependent enzyme [Pseudonocardia sp. DSM 110487]|uniref:type III PLP-dependent enzyme n=1 Tax=Pseudonocardia sp. DSM 110487 TaxID=2865833 RepID=UPI001C6A086C|nr:type III PLP-dependent enzyme [Pseudonocardia sp. DSM 110487]QYN33111.1 type III PLP-dependent enzyme [Pseudonocardia sp. DSM 110487]